MTAADQFGPLDYVQWSADVLGALGATPGANNLAAMVAWCLAEGGHNNNSASWNPLGTTMTAENAGLPPEAVVRVINSHGVKAYRSRTDGLTATVRTLQLGRYTAVVAALRSDAPPAAVSAAVATSGWGTGAGIAGNVTRARDMIAKSGTVTPAAGGAQGAGGWVIPNPLDLLPGGDVVTGGLDTLAGLARFANMLGSWETWRRVLLTVGGAALVALGLSVLGADLSGVASSAVNIVEAVK